jgi:hypothetical protein
MMISQNCGIAMDSTHPNTAVLDLRTKVVS